MTEFKTILITEADDEVGKAGAKVLYDETPHRLILACRTMDQANAVKEEVEKSCDDSDPANLIPMQCDLGSFKSITSFSVKLQFTFSKGIDVVCLNCNFAGDKNEKKAIFTDDGLEETIAYNHFGPFLLVHRIMDVISDEGRIIVTTSDLHLKTKTGRPSFQGFAGIKDEKGKLNKHFSMIDGKEFDRAKAFSLAKLCNVTFTSMLDYRLEKQGKGTVANCFDPGITPFEKKTLMKKVTGKTKSKDWAGGALAFMADDDTTGTLGGNYWKGPDGKKGSMFEIDFKPHEVNPEASDELNQKMLWKLSARLCGVDDDDC